MNHARIIAQICLFLLPAFRVAAQSQGAVYTPANDIKVSAYGKTQSMPWGGGLNNPEFAMGDLNNDGKQDLIVFEPGIALKTYLNTGTAGAPVYEYAPQYERNFPGVKNYLIMADYNCDNVPDLFFQSSIYGFLVYRGYYNAASELCFTFYKALYYANDSGSNGPVNATVNQKDMPSIADIDGDGDLDFLSYEGFGEFVQYYRNMRVELGLPCDSIVIDLKDRCWGKYWQPYWLTHTLNYSCDNSGLAKTSKVTDGGNSFTLFDYDDDGDYDVLDGNTKFPQMTLLINSRAQTGGKDSIIYQDTTWPSVGHTIVLPAWPAAFNVDIDQDGQKDLLIAPHASGASENYKCVWYYKNSSTPGHPVWTFESDTMLVDQMIDVGTAAMPMLYDYDKDGLPDLFVGNEGYYQSNGTLRSAIAYYHNTSTKGNPSFELVTKDFLDLFAYNIAGLAPAFGDLDNDGKDDMILGHTDGTLSLCRNSAANGSAQPQWVLTDSILKDVSNNIINTGSNAAPFIYDLNKDGKPDLIIGGNLGYLQYYENTSTATGQLSLTLRTTKLGNVKVNPMKTLGNYSTPFIGKIDNTGREYLLVGSNSGNIYRFDSFQTGYNAGAVYAVLDTEYSYIDSSSNNYNYAGQAAYTDLRVAPAVGDIDGDGLYEMVLGNSLGGIRLYRQLYNVSTSNTQLRNTPVANVYPNPARDVLYLSWSNAFGSGSLQVALYTVTGQKVQTATLSATAMYTKLSLQDLPPGVYYCVLQSAGNKVTLPVTLVK